jgi:hypothetical protein
MNVDCVSKKIETKRHIVARNLKNNAYRRKKKERKERHVVVVREGK